MLRGRKRGRRGADAEGGAGTGVEGGKAFTSKVNLPADDMRLLLEVSKLVNGSPGDEDGAD